MEERVGGEEERKGRRKRMMERNNPGEEKTARVKKGEKRGKRQKGKYHG